jgi:hypothetical protein
MYVCMYVCMYVRPQAQSSQPNRGFGGLVHSPLVSGPCVLEGSARQGVKESARQDPAPGRHWWRQA